MRDDFLRCYYTRWAGEDNVKEDLIILENLYPQVGCSEISPPFRSAQRSVAVSKEILL